jgi:putative endonuclease
MKKNKGSFFSTKKKGWLTETIAYFYLKICGYNILERNFQTRLGELDIIAKKKDTIIVFEVKSRFQKNSWHPLTAIDSRKKKKLNQLTRSYIQMKQLFCNNIRIDIITLEKKIFWFQVKHYKNIF